MAPRIEQQVAWPSVVAADPAQSVEAGHIADSAQIDDCPGPARGIKKRGMEGGDERCSLPACRDVG